MQAGYKEITLLGQNVNSYGKGLEEQIDFSDLLNLLCSVPRFSRPRRVSVSSRLARVRCV